MNAVTPYRHEDSTERTADIFSVEPERRSVELAFVRRIMESAPQAAARLLRPSMQRASADADFSSAFDADYARMQSPVFKLLARRAEKLLPKKVGFRRFGKKR